ncbi:glucosaminidase domain-containing protein [Phocaeicola sp. KGMB11183]|uniref:Peptidoglycan hydrolase n=2 Tax=Phocaeicola acetigenes TaxID=3016083 RepID=A0ABT4PDH3_9BACT|nr:glucosaminidase domain-containing protein [Phocaeicola sp. KGMB11183]MCZ8371104.1 glucosaminidase domain-containing protein [Phocaeicola sp. KGMB11183]
MLPAQRRNQAYEDYIKKYRKIAVEEMERYHIPASITLAQGLLESGAGRSTLARKSNNHFGIKCGSRWEGRTVRHDDDARNECFRAYKHPRDSYEDHSKFLRTGARYAFLFRLKITDYKGWARGLKKAGYATDPRYADRLIDIIELYDLDKYDRKGGLKWAEEFPDPHQPYLANELLYIVARRGDTFESLSKEMGISKKKIRKYNELPKDYKFQGGEIVYLEKKRSRATKDHICYTVRPGDSMYSISQKFGVRLSRLYKMNNMKPESPAPKVGEILRLR